jgi:hypothetical protein
MSNDVTSQARTPREGRLLVAGADLYCRDIGQGPPIIAPHGGLRFNRHYLLPDRDAWPMRSASSATTSGDAAGLRRMSSPPS